MRPMRSLSTCAAIRSSARQPLQIWRVRSSESRPAFQLTSSGWMPVAYSPANSRSKRSRSTSIVLCETNPCSTIRKPSRWKVSTCSSERCSRTAGTTSEQLEVAVQLPLRDLLVGLLPLAALAAHEVVEVVLVAAAAESRAQDVAALELAGRVEQVGRQHVDAELLALGL